MPSFIAVVGDAVLDVLVAPSEPIRPGGDVRASIRLEPGGQGANVAVRLARRGVPVRLVCALGPDTAGRILRDALAADEVAIHDLGAPATGSVVALLDAEGERTMLSQRVPLLDRLEPMALTGVGWTVVSGYLLLENTAAALEIESGRTLLLGCSLRADQANGWLAAASRLGPDLIVLNEAEASMLAGLGSPTGLSRQLGGRLGGLAVVTSTDGAAVVAGSEVISVSRAPVDAAIDTTGAGDAFAATLLMELLELPWPPDAGQLRTGLASAMAAASAVTRFAGAQARISGERGR